jgi:hypothetical protein
MVHEGVYGVFNVWIDVGRLLWPGYDHHDVSETPFTMVLWRNVGTPEEKNMQTVAGYTACPVRYSKCSTTVTTLTMHMAC